MKLVIDRQKWARGAEEGMLLNTQCKMCCLGFAALACGLKPHQIKNVEMPADTREETKPTRNKTVWNALLDIDEGGRCDTEIASYLASVNDDSDMSDKMREHKIRQKFKKIGVEVTFKN
jgi:hypothetical protein